MVRIEGFLQFFRAAVQLIGDYRVEIYWEENHI